MYEKEIKIIGVEKTKILDTLQKKGAILLTSHQIIDHYFDWNGDGLKKIGCSFRLRTIGDQNILTFKSKLKSKKLKSCLELENDTSLAHFNFIIAFTGLQFSWKKEKYRTSFLYGECKVEIDEYPDYDPIIEIEGPNYKTIKKTIKSLGLSKYQQLTCGFRGLAKYK